jgi:hypothetical protein
MLNCPLCGSPAEITEVPQFASKDVECPECKKFRIKDRAVEFIEKNPAIVKDQLPWVSKAARAAEVPLLITDDNDIADTAAKQEAIERDTVTGPE